MLFSSHHVGTPEIHLLIQCFNGRIWHLFTAHKRSLGQGNIFAPVCHSVHGGSTWGGTPGDQRQVPPSRYTPRTRGRYPPAGTPLGPEACTIPSKYPPGKRGRYPPSRYIPPGPEAGTSPADAPPQTRGRYTPLAGTPPGTRGRYPLAGTPPPDQRQVPPHTPGRYTPGRYTPGRYTPPADTPPSTVPTGRYGQQAGGTHPTWMQSCFLLFSIVWKVPLHLITK